MLVQFNSQYRRMFAELLAGHAPLAFNCSAGKDRTGLAAALLLAALGVPRATVIEDWGLTLPVCVALLAWAILKEKLHGYHYIGGGVVLLGVVIGLREWKVGRAGPYDPDRK